MNDKLTYEEALEIVKTTVKVLCSIVPKENSKVLSDTTKSIKKLKEAIEKAKRYDELTKEKE